MFADIKLKFYVIVVVLLSVFSLNGAAQYSLQWKYTTQSGIYSSPVVDGNAIFIGSNDSCVYSLNAQEGQLNWKFKTKGNEYFPKGEIQKGATSYNQSVVFGCRDYFMYSLNMESGKLNWSKEETNSWIIAAPLLVDGLLYYGTSDSHCFRCVKAATGEIKTSFPLNMRVYAEAVLLRNQILFGCFNGKLYQIDPASGTIREVFQTDGSKHNYHRVYNDDGTFRTDFKLYGNDLAASERQVLALGSILSTPCIANGIIYLGDSNGCFYALRLAE